MISIIVFGKMNLALFGGSFDPFHKGHMAIIKEALSRLKLDKLIIMPTYLNPFKSSSYFTPSQRYKELKKLVLDERVVISDYEITKGRATTTIESVEHLIALYNLSKIYLIIGADNLELLHTWERYNDLKTFVEFVIASRDNIKIPQQYKILNINEDISSSQIKTEMYTPAC